ncbi:MAG: hypothetical protein IAG13_01040, partial [Deltaproteobacteria bacterium]|nr:hypothetical protein [Nannocystaceae bacterium]
MPSRPRLALMLASLAACAGADNRLVDEPPRPSLESASAVPAGAAVRFLDSLATLDLPGFGYGINY